MSRKTLSLPDLGEGLTEAEIVRWLVAEGDDVTIDQPVVEVETAKAVVEVPTPFAGRVATRHGSEGQVLPVGAPLISFDVSEQPAEHADENVSPNGSGNVLVGYGTGAAATPGRRLRPRVALLESRNGSAPPPSAPPPAAPPPAAQPLVASPVVRRLARERGLDLTAVHGTGAGGMVTRADVEGAVNGNGARTSTGGGRRIPLTPFGKAASANLTRSRSEIPEATVWVDVDATPLVELREAGRSENDPGPGLVAYIASFVVAGLLEYPVLNARFDASRQEIVESERVNLGVAVQGSRGLVVPVVVGADAMSISTLDRELDAAVARARQGAVTADELAAGTFTLNNYGPLGVDGSAAIINYPQVATLGVGRIMDRPWVVRGRIRPRKITQLSFVFDHRVCDGVIAAGFVRAVADAIENPVRALARR